MYILCAYVDSNIIKLIGWFRIYDMLLYLRVEAEPTSSNIFSLVLACGMYYFVPHHEAPCF